MLKTTLRLLATLLALLVLIGSMPLVSVSAEEPPEETYRYYFYMPDEWYNEDSDGAGIYWWEGSYCESWPGYDAIPADAEGVYYYDVPYNVTSIIWNNGVSSGTNAYQTKNIGTEYYEAGESENYPDGTDNFNNMIYVVDFEKTYVNDYSGVVTYGGEWYYYYGNGEYGFAPEKEDADEVFTEDAFGKIYTSEDVVGIEPCSDTVQVIENLDGWWEYRYNTETEEDEEYFYYNYSLSDFDIKVNLSDGNYVIKNFNDYVYGDYFDCYDNQEDKPWIKGEDNSLTITYMDYEIEVAVEVVDHPIESIEVISDSIEVIENIDGYWETEEEYNEETGRYEEFFFYEYPYYDIEIKVNYKDGTSETSFVGDMLNDYHISCYSDQYANHWTVGNDYYVTIEYMGVTTKGTISVIENPVQSIEVVEGTVELDENVYGYWDIRYNYETENEEEYFCYYYNLDDVKLKINYKDGTSETAYYYETVNGYSFSDGADQQLSPWVVDGENIIPITYLGVTTQISAIVKEDPVESIFVYSGKIEVVENVDGRWRERYNYEIDGYEEFFYYDCNMDDIKMQINYKDGSSVVADYYDTVDGYDFSRGTDQYNTPWTIGGDNIVTISYKNVFAEITAIVKENPVESIEVVSGSIELDEYSNGEWFADDDGEFFYYYYDLEDIEIKVNYKDGTSETVYGDEELNGYSFYYESDQYDTHWTVDGDNIITISYLGFETEISVVIIPDNVESIELYSGSIELIENYYGDWEEFYDYDTDESHMYFEYDYYEYDLEIKVNYTDGSSKIVRVGDELDGYYPDVYDNQYWNHWTVGGENIMYIRYKDNIIEYNVTIKENLVESIEVVSGSIELIENYDGYMSSYWNDYDEEVEFFYYEYDCSDIQVQVNYTDGTSKVATADEVLDGYWINCYDNQYEDHWGVGEDNLITINYLNAETTFSASVIKTPVESIELVSDVPQYIVNTNGYWSTIYNEETGEEEEYFRYWTPENVELKINFKDGTSENAYMKEYLNGYYIGYSHNQSTNHWTLDKDNYFEVHYMGFVAEIPVDIIESPVERIEVIKGTNYFYELYTNGYFGYVVLSGDTDYTRYFYYYDKEHYDIQVRIYYTDGTTKDADMYDMVDDGYYVDYYNNQEKNPWQLGKNELIVTYMGVETTTPVYVRENDVESVSLIGDVSIDVLEGEDGYWNDYYNNNTQTWIDYFYYYYDIPEDAELLVTYKDGFQSIITIESDDYVCIDDNQFLNPWVVGKDNKLTLCYKGEFFDIPVNVIPNPDNPITEPVIPTVPEEDATVTTVVTDPAEDTTVTTVVTDPAEDAIVTTVVTDPAEDTTVTTAVTDPAEDTTVTTAVTDPAEDTTVTTAVTDPAEGTTVTTAVTNPAEDTTVTTAVTDPAEDTTVTTAVTDPVEDTTATTAVTEPVEDTTATEPTEATKPTKPVETKPTKPAEPKPTKPAEPKPTKPAETTPTEPSKPANVIVDDKTQITIETEKDEEVELNVVEIVNEEKIEEIDLILVGEKSVKVYDITLTSGGVEVQPDGKVTVRIPVGSEFAKIYRMETDGTLTDMKAEYKDGCLVFTTEHFSIYVVAEPEKEATPDEPVVDKGILGDVNGDGKVNIKDATQIQKFAAKLVELTDAEFIRADVNADTKVNIKDATAIQKFVAKLETGLPIGEPAA